MVSSRYRHLTQRKLHAWLPKWRALSTEVIKGVSDRAGGVPLFVEEVTRLLIERGERGGA
jgi:predicted ATPase